MNSRDIYRKIEEKMTAAGVSVTILGSIEEKGKIIAAMKKALTEYSYEKLCEMSDFEQIVIDLEVILDTIADCLPDSEKETFFEPYVHCMLNIYNSMENKGILWSVEETDTPEAYPKFEKEGRYLEFFKTTPSSKNKDTVLWLTKYLSDTYSCKSQKIKTK